MYLFNQKIKSRLDKVYLIFLTILRIPYIKDILTVLLKHISPATLQTCLLEFRIKRFFNDIQNVTNCLFDEEQSFQFTVTAFSIYLTTKIFNKIFTKAAQIQRRCGRQYQMSPLSSPPFGRPRNMSRRLFQNPRHISCYKNSINFFTLSSSRTLIFRIQVLYNYIC